MACYILTLLISIRVLTYLKNNLQPTMKSNQQIVNHLMLKSIEISDISLYHGKMGIVLALYIYSQQSAQEHIKDYAWDLLQEIYKGVNETQPVGLEYGLSGIGYGTTLLKKYGIFDCDLDEVLCSIDQKIMAYDPLRITDFTFRTGAWGLSSYIRLRMNVEGKISSFDTQYLHVLRYVLSANQALYNGIPEKTIWADLQAPDWELSDFRNHPLGIDKGLAYYLVNNLNLH